MDSSTSTNPDAKSLPVVLVMGLTGAGKTTLINHLTGESFPVASPSNTEAVTETSTPAVFTLEHDSSLRIDIQIVDTPGFDDPEKSDAQVLIDITNWIKENLGGTNKITAALYLHDIQKPKRYASVEQNFILFSKLVGSESMKNVGLVMTHWDKIEKEVGQERELNFMAKSWKLMLAQGAKIYRTYNTKESCMTLVRDLLSRQPSFIQIQKEMAAEFEGKPLRNTEAGTFVYTELEKRIAAKQASIVELEEIISSGKITDPSSRTIFDTKLKECKQTLAQLEDDKERVKKVPSWRETAWNAVVTHGPGVVIGQVLPAILRYRSGIAETAAIKVAEETARRALNEAATAKSIGMGAVFTAFAAAAGPPGAIVGLAAIGVGKLTGLF